MQERTRRSAKLILQRGTLTGEAGSYVWHETPCATAEGKDEVVDSRRVRCLLIPEHTHVRQRLGPFISPSAPSSLLLNTDGLAKLCLPQRNASRGFLTV